MLKLIYNESLKLLYQFNVLVMALTIPILTIFSSILMRRLNISPASQNAFGGIQDQLWLTIFVNLFIIIIASGIVANEYNWGTIKLLLIRPISKSKLLLAKYLTVALFGFLFLAVLFVFAFFVNYFLYGLGNPGESILLGKIGSKDFYASTFIGILKIYLLRYSEVFTYGTIAFMLSVISKSNAFAAGFSIILMFVGPLLSSFIDFKYYLFSIIDLAEIYNGDEGFDFSLIALSFYIIIFNLISGVIFIKRDVP